MTVIFGMPSNWSTGGSGSSGASSSSASSSVKTFSDPTLAKAQDALALLFKDDELLTQLAKSSFKYLPPAASAMKELIWGLINVNSNSEITGKDVEDAVRNAGGDAAAGTSLWRALDPDYKGKMTANDFVDSEFFAAAVSNLVDSVREDVETKRAEIELEDARGKSNSILDQTTGYDPDGTFVDVFV